MPRRAVALGCHVGQHAVHVTEKLGQDNEIGALGERHARDGWMNKCIDTMRYVLIID